jgi:hypothetical protein
MTDAGSAEFLKLALFYASYLYFPAAAFLVWRIAKRPDAARKPAALILVLLTAFAYGRFVEPRILLTVEHDRQLLRCFPVAGGVRLAVVSDVHQGVYRNAVSIRRIARRVDSAAPDLVLIAGDFSSRAPVGRFDDIFGPLGDIKAPVYAVLGNHDRGLPGPDVAVPLTAALEQAGVRVIDDQETRLRVRGAEIELVGISDLWWRRQRLELFDGVEPRPRLALTHNPSTVGRIDRPRQIVDLMIAGHTHGGQIYIPLLTCAFTDACDTVRYGFKEAPRGLVFVTSGTGMSILPLRFNAPPRIDVVNLSWRACPESGAPAPPARTSR